MRPSMLRNVQASGGLRMFFFQYFVQAGVFFVVPLFLSVSLGLSAIDTGVRILPLSITLLLAAAGIPRFRPNANPRRVVQARAGRHVRRHRRAAGRDRRGRLGRDRHAAAVAARLRDRRAGLAARRRHRVCRARRAKPRGRRPAEHRDQPWCVAGHRAGGLGADRQPHRDPAGRHRAEPGRPARAQPAGRYAALKRRPLPLRRRPRGRARAGRRDRPDGRRRSWTRTPPHGSPRYEPRSPSSRSSPPRRCSSPAPSPPDNPDRKQPTASADHRTPPPPLRRRRARRTHRRSASSRSAASVSRSQTGSSSTARS